MRRVKIIYEYDGSEFCGSQIQKNGISVQEVLEKAIEKTTGRFSRVTASGRTDAGVSAYRQVAHFDTQSDLAAEKFHLALNAYLPDSVRVCSAENAAADFHARFSAKSKTYVYKMYPADVASPIRRKTHLRIPAHTDVEAMQRGCREIEGQHDFKSFMASGSKIENTVRTVFDCRLERHVQNEVWLVITADGFLYNMVRIIVGTLLDYAEGKCGEIAEIIAAKDRSAAGKTAPPQGLYLAEVAY